jgi:uncharacterized membrane protein YfcA
VQLYLPIAELAVDIFLIFGIGAAIGFISGLLGVGGGFLLTPLLIFSGIPTAVAVGTGAAHVLASSSSATLAYWRRKQVDLKLAFVLFLGGIVGSAIGVIGDQAETEARAEASWSGDSAAATSSRRAAASASPWAAAIANHL